MEQAGAKIQKRVQKKCTRTFWLYIGKNKRSRQKAGAKMQIALCGYISLFEGHGCKSAKNLNFLYIFFCILYF
jgi:hypothetical protein